MKLFSYCKNILSLYHLPYNWIWFNCHGMDLDLDLDLDWIYLQSSYTGIWSFSFYHHIYSITWSVVLSCHTEMKSVGHIGIRRRNILMLLLCCTLFDWVTWVGDIGDHRVGIDVQVQLRSRDLSIRLNWIELDEVYLNGIWWGSYNWRVFLYYKSL